MTSRLAIAFISLAFAATGVQADDAKVVTFSGQGTKPIEVRDPSGEVTEVIGQNNLTLNQIPADAVAREQQYRVQQNERGKALDAEREQAEAAVANATEEAKAAAEAASKEAAESVLRAEQEYDPTPLKVRRKTVRGTRYVATEPVDPALRDRENSGIRQYTRPDAPAPAKQESDTPEQVWPPPRQKLP